MLIDQSNYRTLFVYRNYSFLNLCQYYTQFLTLNIFQLIDNNLLLMIPLNNFRQQLYRNFCMGNSLCSHSIDRDKSLSKDFPVKKLHHFSDQIKSSISSLYSGLWKYQLCKTVEGLCLKLYYFLGHCLSLREYRNRVFER